MAKEPVQHTSAVPLEDTLAILRDLLPEIFSEGKVDYTKLREVLGDAVDNRPERYSFTWAGKRDAVRLLQVPSRATLEPRPQESVDFDTTRNVFVEGENLEVLKLLYKAYFGRIKMIYIDPPYNTGGDFIYPDNYTDPLGRYLELTGQADAEGNLLVSNPETSGRFHSTWLTMMYPRLFVARQLLDDDGLMFVSIDDNEEANLTLLMNEVFGEENFVAKIIWKKSYGGGAKSKHAVGLHEYVLCFARNRNAVDQIDLPPNRDVLKYYKYRDSKYDLRGPYRTQPLATTSMDDRPNLRYPIMWEGQEIWPEKQWQWSRERVAQALTDDELVITPRANDMWSVEYKQYLRDEDGIERGSKLYTVLDGPYTQAGTKEIAEIFGDGKVFPFPKPSALIRQLASFLWQDEDVLVLDFFAGSCPTAQAVLELNAEHGGRRSFIVVQMPEPTPAGSPARKLGLDTIAEIGKERIRRVAQNIVEGSGGQLELGNDAALDKGFRVFKLRPSSFRQWSGVAHQDPGAYTAQMAAFTDPLVDGWTPDGIIWEVAIKEGYSLASQVIQIEDVKSNAVFRIFDPEIGGGFHICLDDTLSEDTVAQLKLTTTDMFVCRDSALTDTLAANTALQCQLKTI